MSRAARRREGAAMVETLIVCALLILVGQLMVDLFFFAVAKHEAIVNVRAKAWGVALSGCGQQPGLVSGMLDGIFHGNLGDKGLEGAGSNGTPPAEWGEVSPGAEQSVSIDAPLSRLLPTSVITARRRFACNEPPGQDPLSIAGRIGFGTVGNNTLPRGVR